MSNLCIKVVSTPACPLSISAREYKLKEYSCSIDCYKAHQSVHADKLGLPAAVDNLPPKPPPVASDVDSSLSEPNPRDLLGTHSTFSILKSSPELLRLYSKYPNLRGKLKDIYEVSNRPPNAHHGEHPSRRGRGKERDRSGQQGFDGGLGQLRRSRKFEGNDGRALEEFSRLVVQLTEANASKSPTT